MDEIEELENLILGHMFDNIDGGDEVKFSHRAAQELLTFAALDIPHAQAAGNLQLLRIEVNAPRFRKTFTLEEIKEVSVAAANVQDCCVLACGQEVKETLARDRRPARQQVLRAGWRGTVGPYFGVSRPHPLGVSTHDACTLGPDVAIAAHTANQAVLAGMLLSTHFSRWLSPGRSALSVCEHLIRLIQGLTGNRFNTVPQRLQEFTARAVQFLAVCCQEYRRA